MTQEQEVLDYMQSHIGITSMVAFAELGITRLSAKIFNLRKQGYDIMNVNKETKNRNGKTVHFVEYRLRG